MSNRLIRPWGCLGLSIILISGCSSPSQYRQAREPANNARPNFLVIVADDLGFSDAGFMGSEIRTPNLDRLAADGLLMTQFHVSPACSPTRAMLLAGTDNHPAGLGTMNGEWGEGQQGQPGYEGVLSDRVVTVATLLRDAGYDTYHVGKWHLGSKPGKGATSRGFERSFGPARGGASHFADQLKMFFRDPTGSKALYLSDGRALDSLPADFYSSRSYTDRLIENIESGRATDRPFFAYAAYTAPHWPLQVPDADLDLYAGVYDEGWDALRQRRVAALANRGLAPPATQAPDRVPWERAWKDLTVDERRRASRRMEIYAAMVENLDRHVGRLIHYLKATGQYDNTLVLFFSDNGAEGNPVNRIMSDHGWVDRTFDNSRQNMGRVGSYVFTGPGWAQASTAPLSHYKSFPTQGGIRVPALAAGGRVPVRGRTDTFVSVMDVAPTLLELAGVPQPTGWYGRRPVAPMEGASMAGLLSGRSTQVHPDDHTMGWELFGRRALRRGHYKIVWLYPPYGDGRWALFNLQNDPGESVNLAARHPEILAELEAAWDRYAERHGVILPPTDSGYALDDPW